MSDLTHLDAAGHARMVDVAGREVTTRTATASGRVTTSAAALIRSGDVPKGDVLAVARIAGIMATKRTPDLIPLCHPIAVHGVDVRGRRWRQDADEVLHPRHRAHRGPDGRGDGGPDRGGGRRARGHRHGQGRRPARRAARRPGGGQGRRPERGLAPMSASPDQWADRLARASATRARSGDSRGRRDHLLGLCR